MGALIEANALRARLSDPERTDLIQRGLPPGMNSKEGVQRFQHMAWMMVLNNPDLRNCDERSLVKAFVDIAQWGLVPDGMLGEAWVVRYGQKAQPQVGYKGLVKLAMQGGYLVAPPETGVIRERDTWHLRRGLDPVFWIEPDPAMNTPVTHVWAVAEFVSGRRMIEVMTVEQVEARRPAYTKGKGNNPWATHWDEMARKTVLRSLLKSVPKSATAQVVERAIAADEEPLRQMPEPIAVASEPPPIPQTGRAAANRLADRVPESDVTIEEDRYPDQEEVEF